jgi:hypothetical protein
MKNFLQILICCLFLISTHLLFAQSTNGSTTSARENWFPNRGKVGVGTRTPSEDLEVIGNVKITNTLFSQTLRTSSIESSSLLLFNNAVINGRLGIGVANPSEALDVLGNFRLQGTLRADNLIIGGIESGSGIFNTLTVNQNSLFKGLSTFNEDVSFSKNALITGRIGIGTAAPTESLDVLGNIKSSAGLFSLTLNTGSAQFGENVTFSKNASITGRLGIGVLSPSEAIDVIGNIKTSEGLYSSTLNSGAAQFNTLNVSDNSTLKDLFVNGKLGIGVNNPSESLDINGNLKLTGGMNGATLNVGQATISQGFTAGSSSVSGNLTVSGMLNSQSVNASDITASNNISMSSLTTTGNATIGQKLGVTGDATVNGKLNAPTIFSTDLNVSNELEVTGLSELKGGAAITGNTSMNNVSVTGTFSAENLAVNSINATGNASVGQNLTVNGNGAVQGTLGVSGALTAGIVSSSQITITNDLTVGQNLKVNGTGTVAGNLSVNGSSNITGDLNIQGILTASNFSLSNVNTSGNATISQNLVVNGLSQLGGDLQVAGNVKAGIIEATEFRTTSGGSAFNFDNAIISQTLAISTTNSSVPENYKLAVGGNIIATGVDIKVPQKWPDYVFTDGHKLLTIDEVSAFVKEHGHLPNVLSAKQMEQRQNYSVSEMDAKLLEKIEELTLYIIELKGEIEQLKSKSNKK